jgi:hypothetical protein
VWSHDGILCTGEVYHDHLRLTFMKGRELPDPHHLFEPCPPGQARRVVKLREGDTLPGPAFRAIIRHAVALNTAGARR